VVRRRPDPVAGERMGGALEGRDIEQGRDRSMERYTQSNTH
jgi:hypothetical protein